MNDDKRIEQRLATDEPNLVCSFESGFISLEGAIAGVCIKYRTYGGNDRIAHWPNNRFRELFSCLARYSEAHWSGSDMQKSNDPKFLDSLPARHPYHTVEDDAPSLTEAEIGASTGSTCVSDFEFVDRGKACEVRCIFRDGGRRTDILPEYIAMNLWGYLESSIEVVDNLLRSDARGSA
jgi:hypothetical protein